MKFSKLTLKNYKKYNSKSISFVSGTNIVLGLNEAGKSTIADALLDCLFSDPNSKSKTLLEKISSWHSSLLPVLTLEFESKSSKYQLTKDFENKKTVLIDLNTNKVEEGIENVNKILEKEIPIFDKQTFEASGFIKQKDLPVLKSNKSLQSSLKKSLTQNIDVDKLIFDLEKESNSISKGINNLAKYPGEIKRALNQVESFESQLKEITTNYNVFIKAQSELFEFQNKLSITQNKISDLEDLISKNKLRIEDQEKVKKIEEELFRLEDRIKKIESLLFKQDELSKELKSLNEDNLSYQDLKNNLLQLEQKNEIFNQQNQNFEKHKIAQKNTLKEKFAKIILPLLILILGALFTILINNLIIFIIVLGLSIIVFFIQKNLFNYFTKNLLNDESEQAKQANLLNLNKTNQEISNILKLAQVENIEMFNKKYEKIVLLKDKQKEIKSTLEGLLANEKLIEMQNKSTKLLINKKELSSNLTLELKSIEISPQEIIKKQRELKELQESKESLQDRISKAKATIELYKNSPSELEETKANLLNAKSDLEYWQTQNKVILLTKESLQEAITNVAVDLQNNLSDFIGIHLKELTNNRYQKAKIVKNFEIKVFSTEKNAWISPDDNLSIGTIDQIYLLLRIAFVNYLANLSSMPIIFDDPFVTFDKQRLNNTKKILKKMSTKNQLIIFTHNDYYKEWNEHIVEI